jgi:hypothetical protein
LRRLGKANCELHNPKQGITTEQQEKNMKRIVLLPALVGLTLAVQPLYAGNATLTSIVDFNGNNVTYDNSFLDWRVFASAANGGNPVMLSGGGGLIGAVSADGTLSPQNDSSITTRWSSGTPVGSYDSDSGYLSGIGGYMYCNYSGPLTYMTFSVTSPNTDYTIDIYTKNYGYGYDANLTLENGGTINTYDAYSSDFGWVNNTHLVIEVTGSNIGDPTTITFSNFQGDDPWGQFGIYSAAVSGVAPVPEPTTIALAALGGAGLLLFHRRKG